MSLEDCESPEYAQIKHKRGLVDTDALPDAIMQKQEYQRLYDVVNQLPPDQRDLVCAIYFGDCKAADYARKHGISKSAVSQRLKRALHNLKKLLS